MATLQELLHRLISDRYRDSKDSKGLVSRAERVVALLGPLRSPSSILPADVARLRSLLKSEGLSGSTVNRYLTALGVILRQAEEEGLVGSVQKIRREREPEGRCRILSPEEISDISALLLGPQHLEPGVTYSALIYFLVETGMRVSEALRLRWEDLTNGRAVCSHKDCCGEAIVRQTKSGKPRTVPLTGGACRALGWPRCNPAFFAGPFTHVDQFGFNRAWNAAKARLPSLASDPDVVPHALRHTCASRLIRAGVPLPVVKDWLGHASIKTTMRYVHLDTAALRRAAEAMENLKR